MADGKSAGLHGIGCSKMTGCKAPESPRTEAYCDVRRRDEGNAADGRFGTADQTMTNLRM